MWTVLGSDSSRPRASFPEINGEMPSSQFLTDGFLPTVNTIRFIFAGKRARKWPVLIGALPFDGEQIEEKNTYKCVFIPGVKFVWPCEEACMEISERIKLFGISGNKSSGSWQSFVNLTFNGSQEKRMLMAD
jgi:hypothetical protein